MRQQPSKLHGLPPVTACLHKTLENQKAPKSLTKSNQNFWQFRADKCEHNPQKQQTVLNLAMKDPANQCLIWHLYLTTDETRSD